MEQLGMSLERQLTKAATVTFTYMHSSGFHQLVVRDANAFEPGTFQYGNPAYPGTRPDTNATCTNAMDCPGIVKQYFPEAVFNENQLIVNVNARFSAKLSLTGFYAGSWANSDGGGGSSPSNSYDLRQDYGRAAFIRPQWVFLMGNYTGPWAITFNPFLVAQAGQPYNVTSPYDLTGDAFFNDRPAYATSSTPIAGNVVQTSFSPLDVVPQIGEKLVPISLGNSPSSVAVNLRVGRTFGIGPKVQSPGGPPPGGGGGGGRGGGGGFGGGFGGGPFGGGGGGGPRGLGGGGANSNAKKYSLNFNVQALNLFNDIDLGKPVGGIQPTLDPATGNYGPGAQFGKSSGLAGGIFSTSSAARRIFFQAAFQF
jgi:hypothetical protein